MDLEKIKAQIAELKDKVIDNVDKHFNQFILDDIFDSGEVDIIDNPINDYDWYLYWKIQSSELRKIFYTLFNGNSQTPKDTLLNECMELKKVIDKNLISNTYYDYYDLMEWYGNEVDDQYNKNYIPLSNDNSKNAKIINVLYESLLNEGLIEASFDHFNPHFTPNTSKLIPIRWLGTEIQMVALISLMVDEGLIPKSMHYKKAEIIVTHFQNRKGKDFKIRQLSVKQSNFYNDEVQHLFENITQIVNKLAQIN